MADRLTTDTPLNTDRLSMLPRTEAATAALAALDGVQGLRPEALLLGVATLFAALCHRTGQDPRVLHGMGLAVVNADSLGDIEANNAMQVLRDFAGARIMGQEVTIQ